MALMSNSFSVYSVLGIHNFALDLTFAALSLHRFPKLSRDEGRKSSFEIAALFLTSHFYKPFIAPIATACANMINMIV